MRHLDMRAWPRREHFGLFRSWDWPHFSMCANVDLTAFRAHVTDRGISFNLAVVYLLARTANEIPEFRYRIRGDEVVEHEIVHPSSTILVDGDLFTFCTMEYREEFAAFAAGASQRIAHAKGQPSLRDSAGADDLLYMTAIPWVSFTSFMHPLNLPADSIPRFAWGRFFPDGSVLKMPLSVQGHHAVMDGVHMGRFYEAVQRYLDRPEMVLGS